MNRDLRIGYIAIAFLGLLLGIYLIGAIAIGIFVAGYILGCAVNNAGRRKEL